MQVDDTFEVPPDRETRAVCLEQLAADVRSGGDQAEAIARLALILAADHRDQICL